MDNSMLNVTGNDAIVDWVMLEIYEETNLGNVLYRRALLLQRDGDAVDAATGEAVLYLEGLAEGDYLVSLRHRNHLDVFTTEAVTLSYGTTQLVDFGLPTTLVSGLDSRLEVGGSALMWAGDANVSQTAIANGPGQDTNVVLGQVLTAPGNTLFNANYLLPGYQAGDFNLDGTAIFTGPGNDINILLGNILLHPQNSTFAANYIIRGSFGQ